MIYCIKDKMKNGKTIFGTWCMLPSSFVVDVIARTGLDFVVIDMEHGAITLETAEDMVRAAQLQQCQPIIRVGDNSENTILHALETGCKAIMVPHISSVEEAEHVVMASRYTPEGKRGLSPYTRCHAYTHESLAESMVRNNQETLVGVLVEGKQGIDNLEEITKVKGIDLVYLGLYDISQSIGLPGQLEHPDVLKQMRASLKQVHAQNKYIGTFARDIDSCRYFRELGFDFIAYVADSFGLMEYYRSALNSYHKALSQ